MSEGTLTHLKGLVATQVSRIQREGDLLTVGEIKKRKADLEQTVLDVHTLLKG